MKTTKLIGTMVAVAALAAGLGAPTAALADGNRWEHGPRYYGAPYGKAYGQWKHRHGYPVARGYYYAPPVVRYYRPPVVVYPAPVYPAYAPVYPVYPGGSFTFSYSGTF